MLWRPPSSTLTDTLFPAPTLFRSPAEPDCTRGQGEPDLPDAEHLQLVAEAAPRLTGMMRDGQRDRDGREREHARHDDERGAPAHLLAEKGAQRHAHDVGHGETRADEGHALRSSEEHTGTHVN